MVSMVMMLRSTSLNLGMTRSDALNKSDSNVAILLGKEQREHYQLAAVQI